MTREEEIQFNKVLNKGQLFINFPVIIIIAGLMGISSYLYTIGRISDVIMGVGLISSFVIGWLFWAFFIPIWRIWAFEKIDEKYHLKLKNEAIRGGLIWADKHIFEKTEIRNRKQKAKIQAINDRINELNNTK